mmetsp:Transcript_14120/g.31518  ORF Transcript_14120/g.31518 Transcript_14120/m.31518 type:complete len:278 (-) Transcript_14120:217-1050(-)
MGKKSKNKAKTNARPSAGGVGGGEKLPRCSRCVCIIRDEAKSATCPGCIKPFCWRCEERYFWHCPFVETCPLPTKRCEDCLNGKTMAELAMDSDGTLPKSRGQTPWAHFSRSIVPSDLLRELAESRPEALAFVACQAKGCDCCRCQLCVDESEAKARRTDGVPHYLTCDSCHTTKCYHCGGAEDYFFRCFKCYTSYWLPRLHLGNGKACMPCYWSSKPCTNPDCPNDVGVPTKRCGDCRRARYCSKECQIAMWPKHKEECSKMTKKKREEKSIGPSG